MDNVSAPDAKAWMVKPWRDLETARRVAGDEALQHAQSIYDFVLKLLPMDA